MFGAIHVICRSYTCSSHAALTKKRKIFDSRAVVCCADHPYTLYPFRVICEGKERKKVGKKKERKRKKEQVLR